MENAKCYAPQILVGTEGLPREQWLEYGARASAEVTPLPSRNFTIPLPGGISTMTS